MNKLSTLLLIISTAITGFSQTVNWHHHPGDNQGFESVVGLKVDSQGNSYIVGRITDTTDMDPSAILDTLNPYLYNSSSTPSIKYVQKLDPSGKVLWTKAWESISSGGASAVKDIEIMNNQFIYITGWYQGSLRVDLGPNADTLYTTNPGTNSYLFKLDLNGNFLSKTKFTDSKISVAALAIDHDDNIILSGSITGTQNIDLSGNPSYLTSVGFKDCFTAKYNASLQLIWAHRYGGNGQENPIDVIVDNDGNIITTGIYQSSSNDFDPGSGTASLPLIDYYDAYIQKVDKDGNFKWVKAAVSNGFSSVDHLAISNNNEIYATGSFSIDLAIDYPTNNTYVNVNSNSDSYVWALDSNGVTKWTKIINGNSSNDLLFVKIKGNELLLGGRANALDTVNVGSLAVPYYLDTLTTGYIAYYDLNGNLNSTYEINGGYSKVVDVDFFNNETRIAGEWFGNSDFNAGPIVDTLKSKFIYDFFVMGVSPVTVSSNEIDASLDNFIYPNPIFANEPINYPQNYQWIETYDYSGKLIHSSKELKTIQKSGLYILKFHTRDGIKTKRLIVK
jgi:hypothetical protein